MTVSPTKDLPKILDEQLANLGISLNKLAELQKKHSAELEELQAKQSKEWDALVYKQINKTPFTIEGGDKSCTHGASYFCQNCPGCEWDEVDEII